MTSCSASYTVRSADSDLLLVFAHQAATNRVSALPISRTEAPDPPPPKA
jgi:hypothetical protein